MGSMASGGTSISNLVFRHKSIAVYCRGSGQAQVEGISGQPDKV